MTPTPSVVIVDNIDLTSPVHELQSFNSVFHALQWKYIRARMPICWKRLLQSRYMLANIVYFVYSIGILIINFHPSFNQNPHSINRYYVVLGWIHFVSASLYLWAWRDRSWLDIIMIPEYLNHIEAILYLWSAFWYSKQDSFDGYYTLAIHRIELTAALIGLMASLGW